MAFKDNAVELEERLVAVNRVTKVVKGGRRLRFAALVVVGDRNGRVGFGTGKAQEVPEAIRKAVEDAKKNLIEVPMVGTTIPHEVLSEFGGAKVLLKPAVEGSGVAAGGAVRAVVELAGVADITSKSLGSNTPINIVRATVEGLKQLKRAEEVAALVVVGDRNGRVGFGTGKAQEVPEAIRKAVEDAKKNLIEVPMVGTTIPHEVTSVFGGARVLLKPAVEGAGVAAGGAVRAVVELAGIADVTSKSLGSNTPINIVRATVEGLKQLKRAEEVAALRGISVSDLA